MLKIEQVLRNEFGENVLGDFFENITIKGEFAIVKKENLLGLYNVKTLKKILECDWDKIAFDREYIIVSRYSKIGIYDILGNNILECKWDKVVLYEYGILVTKNKVQGFYNYNGKPILECVWKRIEPYQEIILAYRGNGAKRVLFNYQGEIEENN